MSRENFVTKNESYPFNTSNSQLGLAFDLFEQDYVTLVFSDLLGFYTHPNSVFEGTHFIFHSTEELPSK